MTPDLIAGRYRVQHAIGRGGMGTVWLCRDEVLGREVAVKQVGALPGESATDRARALREARSSAALNHRNVVSVFDIVDSQDGGAWLVMEYVPSRTLAEIIREDGTLRPRRAAWIAAQVANGLAAAHAVGTIHRDVKPGNILVGQDDVAKIGDFGIARGANDEQLTRTGLVTGTPSYFSPELARGEDPGPESDVYALGATLYTAIEGHPPYPEQRNPIALLQKIAAEEPLPPVSAGPLAGPIDRMMDRDPRSRWSMADAAQVLRRVAEHGDPGDQATTVVAAPAAPVGEGARTAPPAAPLAPAGTATEPTTPGSGSGDRDDTRHRRAVPWVVAAALLLLVVLGVGFMMIGDDSGQQTTASDTESPAPSARKTPSTSPSPSPSPSPSETPTTRAPRTTQPAPAQDSGKAMEQAVQEYFSFMPQNTDAGWQRLAPSMQAQGREGYEDWWDSVQSVDLQSASAAGDRQVDITLTYYFKDGSAKQETQRLTMERSGDRYLIADDAVLSSRTVS